MEVGNPIGHREKPLLFSKLALLTRNFFASSTRNIADETNIADENMASQKETSFPTVKFQGLC